MNSIKALEKKWYQYKLNKNLSLLKIVLSVMVVVLSGYLASLLYWKQQATQAKDSNISTKLMISKEINSSHFIENNRTLNEINNTNSAIVPVVAGINISTQNGIKQEPINAAKVYPSNTLTPKITPKPKKEPPHLSPSEIQDIQQDMPKNGIKINMNSSEDNFLANMEEKFKESKSAKDAVVIARTHYENRDFAKASQWALKANSMDKNMDESWMLFAKSKAKLGQDKEAVSILEQYGKRGKESEAQDIIDKIKTKTLD